MTIGERIKEARRNRKMSQEEMGRMLQIGKSSICEWESGKRPIPIDMIEKIAEVLELTVPYLMGWSLDENKQYTSSALSPAALEIARKFERLDEYSKLVVESVIDIELQRQVTYASEVERFNSLADAVDELIESNA